MSRLDPPLNPRPTHRRLWADLREAVRGSHADFTTGSIGRAIFLLSVPMVLEMLMQSVFEVADIFFVGRLGADAVAAVGLSASLIILVFALCMGLSMAATAMVARRIGEGDPEGAAVASVQALAVSLALSIPISLIGVFFAPELLALMGATPAVIEIGADYCAVLFGGNATILLLFLINALFRGAGDAASAMRALWLANLLNIALDPLFIFGIGPFPEMGVMGAAVATTLGRGIGVGYQLWMISRGTGRLHIRARHLRLDFTVMGRLMRVSSTGILQFLIGTASWMGIMRIVALFGSIALAGYTIAVRIIIFALLPSWGMGNAAATLVGQNLGAGSPDRAVRSVWLTCFVNAAFLGLVGVAFVLWPYALMGLLTPDPEVIAVGARCLEIVAYSFVFWAFGMVMVQAFNGAGDTVTPLWINLLVFWVFQIPLAYMLAFPLGYGTAGIFAGIAIAQSVLAVVAILIFRRGRWQTKAI